MKQCLLQYTVTILTFLAFTVIVYTTLDTAIPVRGNQIPKTCEVVLSR